jgi:hypothetical protein
MSNSPLVGIHRPEAPKSLKTLEQVNGIEPSSSAWKAVGNPNEINDCLHFSTVKNGLFHRKVDIRD